MIWNQILFRSVLVLLLSTVVLNAQDFISPRVFVLPTIQIAVATGDFNNDGIPDVVVGGYPNPSGSTGKIRVLLGRGNGNFLLHGEYNVGFFSGEVPARVVWEIKIGDLNNDGNNDVVVGHTNGADQFNRSPLLSTVLLGNGNGSLQERESNLFFTDEDFVYALELVDFNNDGLLDVLIGTTGRDRGGLFGLRNLGNGSFQRLGPLRFSFPLYDMGCEDINRDGNIDVVFATHEGIVVRYGDGVFFPTAEIISDGSPVYQVVVEDLNSDGNVDIASLDFAGTQIKVYARGNFPRLVPQTYILPKGAGSYLRTVDIDRNGTMDLVTFSGVPSQIYVFHGDGRGRFSDIRSIDHDLPISNIVFDDLDGNGKTDIAASFFSDKPSGSGAAAFLNAPNSSRYYSDFDSDLMSDFTLYRPSEGMWYTKFNNGSSHRYQAFGLPFDRIVPGNYDGDNKADIGVYRDGIWFILHTLDGSVRIEQFGVSNDIPVPADYDNDGRTDVAIYRPSEGRWYIKDVEGFRTIDWGLKDDIPVAADYDGDGLSDIAVWRPSTGIWYVQRSSDGNWTGAEFGNSNFGDIPTPADYDGDGKTDIAIWRPSEGNWYLLQSSRGLNVIKWGISGDIPVPADYDGDSKSDIAVWRPSEGVWYVHGSSDSRTNLIWWGQPGDIPVPAR